MNKTNEYFEKIILEKGSNRLLLHSCCAPCSSSVLEMLSEYFEVTVFYYNPNITDSDEYSRRKEEQIRFIESFNFKNKVDYLEGVWEPDKYSDLIKGHENDEEGRERCSLCYRLRLNEAAKVAKELNYKFFTTTLSVSPYKNAKLLNEIGLEVEREYGVTYLISDFKKNEGYKRSIELSKEYDLYRQDYCGCEYSKKRHYLFKVSKVVCVNLEENCYIVSKEGKCLIIDPGFDFLKINEKIKDEVVAVLITHNHFDHIGALEDLLKTYPVEVYERDNLLEKKYDLEGFKFKVIYTPGHSKDSVTYYFEEEKVMFTGDFIFKNDIGRCDLFGGSIDEMKKSLSKIREYDDDIKIYPGHGEQTKLRFEKEKNYYFNNSNWY